MGLDVYLYQYKDVDTDLVLKLLWFSEEPWEAFQKWAATRQSERGSFPSERDKAESREKFAAKARELGLPESIVTNDSFGGVRVSFPSTRHPEWSVGEWYGSSFTCAIVKTFTDIDLESIFSETRDERRYFRPDWTKARTRFIEVLDTLKCLEPPQIDNFCRGLSRTFDRHLIEIELVIETMDYVLNSENPQEFILLWSD